MCSYFIKIEVNQSQRREKRFKIWDKVDMYVIFQLLVILVLEIYFSYLKYYVFEYYCRYFDNKNICYFYLVQ